MYVILKLFLLPRQAPDLQTVFGHAHVHDRTVHYRTLCIFMPFLLVCKRLCHWNSLNTAHTLCLAFFPWRFVHTQARCNSNDVYMRENTFGVVASEGWE